MAQHKYAHSVFNPAAALTMVTSLLIAGCGGGSGGGSVAPPAPPPPPPPAPPNPHAAYPTVRIQNAAPTAADFIEDVELGTLLTASVNGQQLTLYTFKNDAAGTSNCQINPDSTGCARTWPPLFAGNASTAQGDFTLVTRSDGLKQWAWRGHPLYFFAGGTEPGAAAPTPPDARSGDTFGQLFADIWFIVRPDPFETVTVNDETVFVGKGAILDFGAQDPDVPAINDPANQFPTARSSARNGFTLYTFDVDPGDDNTNCSATGRCSQFWPPLYADLGSIPPSADYKVITRPNGTFQWSYKGKPLYFFVGDNAPRQTNGLTVPPPPNDILWSLAFHTKPPFAPELSALITNVFQSASGGNCTSCHAGVADGPGGLGLGGTRADVREELLRDPSTNTNYMDKQRAAPQSPDTSLLVHKLEGDAGYGNRMPLGGQPLANDVIAAVRQWIANGARNE